MKLLLSSVFSLAIANLGLSQPYKIHGPKAFVDGYVMLDGKPIRHASIEVKSWKTHTSGGAWAVPIITPKVVGVVGGTDPQLEEADFCNFTGTNKIGHFRIAVPAGTSLSVCARAPFKAGWSNRDFIEKTGLAPCARLWNISLGAGEVLSQQFNLVVGHSDSQGGCVQVSRGK